MPSSLTAPSGHQPDQPTRAAAPRDPHQTSLTAALEAHLDHLNRLPPGPAARAAGTLLAATQTQLAAISALRTEAIHHMRHAGDSYDTIASATGLSKTRIAQIVTTHPTTNRATRTTNLALTPPPLYRVDLYT